MVRAGTYVENLDYLGKNLTVRSESGAETTIVDGSTGPIGNASCVVFQSGEGTGAVLQGLTLKGGRGSTYVTTIVGGGIYITDGAHPTVRECVISENVAGNGAGVFIAQGGITCRTTRFSRNRADTYGGALSALNAQIDIADCQVEANVAVTADGAISLANNVNAVIERTVFLGNTGRAGAGLNLGQSTTTCIVRDCDFFENVAWELHGGGLRANGGPTLVERCLFVGNSAQLDGGGLMFIGVGSGNVLNCTFHGNRAYRAGGQVEYYASNGFLANSIFSEGTGGGGVSIVDGSVVISCCDAWQNVGGNYVGISDPTGAAGNIALDPMFCDPFGGEFTLQEDSPCAPFSPAHPSCDLTGARPVACGVTPVQVHTWGAIKNRYTAP
jgi:predicted outer membrane repeat protein